MAVIQNMTVVDALKKAMTLARGGDHQAALKLLQAILEKNPNQPDALQLRGMLARACGDNEEAVDYFKRSLAVNNQQPNVFNNLGNAWRALGQPEQAIEAYRSAIRLVPDYGDALKNLATVQLEMADAQGAVETLTLFLGNTRGDARGWTLLARAFRHLGKLDEAGKACHKALSFKPDHMPALYELAIIHRQSGEGAQALLLLERCRTLAPQSADVQYLMGNCLQENGRIDDAIMAYRAAIACAPGHRDAHASLNRLLWQTGRDDSYLKSYEEALNENPDDTDLLADLAERLTMGGYAQESIRILHEAGARGIDSPEMQYRLGQALWTRGATDEALASFEKALAGDCDNPGMARELARVLICLEDYDRALALILERLEADPTDQQALAYYGLCLRFKGDSRESWLNDMTRFVYETTLQPPESEGSVIAFNSRLEAALHKLHLTVRHPLEQTLRGGTQTVGDLFDHDIPEIRTVQHMIEQAVAHYINGLPDDAEHPFTGRKAADFAMSGSWSVRLRRSGYHMNHLHPEGWISSCYYVGVPDIVDSASDHQGWLKFGETALGLGQRERIARLVQPKVGKLVLFPSYFYHGTIPFEDIRDRTTIAFDIVPV